MKQSKGVNLCLKRTKIRLAAGLRLEPLGELVRSIRNEGHTSKRREEKKGRGGAYL